LKQEPQTVLKQIANHKKKQHTNHLQKVHRQKNSVAEKEKEKEKARLRRYIKLTCPSGYFRSSYPFPFPTTSQAGVSIEICGPQESSLLFVDSKGRSRILVSPPTVPADDEAEATKRSNDSSSLPCTSSEIAATNSGTNTNADALNISKIIAICFVPRDKQELQQW
jgi:hypothetical protein